MAASDFAAEPLDMTALGEKNGRRIPFQERGKHREADVGETIWLQWQSLLDRRRERMPDILHETRGQ